MWQMISVCRPNMIHSLQETSVKARGETDFSERKNVEGIHEILGEDDDFRRDG
jgi:hypothetical protein